MRPPDVPKCPGHVRLFSTLPTRCCYPAGGGGPGGQNEPSWGNQKRCAPLRLCESLVEHRSLPRSLRNLLGQNRVRTKPRILEGDAGRHSVPLSGH